MLDPHATASFLSGPLPTEPPALPHDVPRSELLRSRAALRVGELAAAGGRRTFHHEHRVHLPLPEAWGVEADRGWEDGILPEPKYGAFRHDLPIASFNPGHRGKWTAHELCHTLVGYAWRPDASPLFLATAGRLAETVPVLLWYWLDEIGLARCPRHDGPLFRATCPACARAAHEGPVPIDRARAEALAADAATFLDRELAGVARTRRLGVPCPHVYGSLDLCSDGIAYATGHGARLRSPAYAAFVERFPSPVLWPDLDSLEARVIEVAQGIAHGAPVAVPQVDWAAYDLGQRLFDVWADCDGACAEALVSLAEALAGGTPKEEIFSRYTALHAEYELPAPEDVFAVGYDVPGWPTRSVPQLREGLSTAVPVTLMACDEAGTDLVPAFAAADRAERAHLGVRFAQFLTTEERPAIAALARYEAALRTAGGEPEAVALGVGADERVRFAEGVEVHTFPFDVMSFAERVDAGERDLAPAGDPQTLAFGRDRSGDLVLAEIRQELATNPAAATPDERVALCDLGLLVAQRWPV